MTDLDDATDTLNARIDDLLHRVETVEELFVRKVEARPPLTELEFQLQLRITDATQRLMRAIDAPGPCGLESIVDQVIERIKQLEDRRQSWLEEGKP